SWWRFRQRDTHGHLRNGNVDCCESYGREPSVRIAAAVYGECYVLGWHESRRHDDRYVEVFIHERRLDHHERVIHSEERWQYNDFGEFWRRQQQHYPDRKCG